MSKQDVGNDRGHYEGPDKPNYENSGGRVVASPSYGNDDGFGTPSAPGVRGEAYGSSLPHHERSMGGRNSMIDQFIKRKKGK